MKDDANGWWSMPALSAWRCPECATTSPVETWRECEPYCEDCGAHDGRGCPNCGEQFDHVWGVKKLAEAQDNT